MNENIEIQPDQFVVLQPHSGLDVQQKIRHHPRMCSAIKQDNEITFSERQYEVQYPTRMRHRIA